TELDSSATYEWQDGSTKSSLVADQPGQYRVIASNVCGAVADEIDIAYYQPIVVTLGRDTILCAEEWHVLDASSDVADYYLWEDGSNEELRYIRGPGSYSVRVSNVCEEVVATIDIPECTQCTQYVPNAFSPNDDGYNDIFQPFSSCPMQYYELRIFDRWGNQVYTGNDPQSGWDGSWKNHRMTTGVYTWYVEYTVDEDGALRSVTNAGEVLLNR
ncbi:MAG: gliding motility-associated C-terminal domain-containing protein, partial [Bacteroidota bacterium]